MSCSAKGFTRCTCSENRKISEWSDTSDSDLMKRMANSVNCIIEADTSHSITTRLRRLWRRLWCSLQSAPPVDRPARMVRRKSSAAARPAALRLATISPLMRRVTWSISW